MRLQWDSDCCMTDLHYPSSQPMIPGQDDLFGEATDSGAEPMHEPSGAFDNQQTQPRKTSRFSAVNRDKPDRWKDDIRQSVDLYIVGSCNLHRPRSGRSGLKLQ